MGDCQYRRALVRLRNAISDLSPEALDELNAIDDGASWEAYRVLTLDAKECDAMLRAEVARLTAENERLTKQQESLNRHHQKRESQYEQWLAERTQQLEAAEAKAKFIQDTCGMHEEVIAALGNYLEDERRLHAALRKKCESVVSSYLHYKSVEDNRLSVYIKENGRDGQSPYAELFTSLAAIAAGWIPHTTG